MAEVGDWRRTACILCECNCGLEVQVGGPGGRHFEKIRGDRAHPASQGYACEKAHRLDYYQNGPDRVTAPLRRRPDGTFEEIDWDTAIREVAAKLAHVRDTHGADTIFYFGGGGQGNHLPGGYAAATMRSLGAVYRSNALAQEKTGEFWVNGRMMGTPVRGDFEHAEVALFVGKNPYQSHGMPRARVTLKEIAHDPARTLIVIDPRRSETAELADVHLQVKPGRDAWLLAAMLGVLVQEDLVAHAWLADHASGATEVAAAFRDIPVAAYCAIAGVDEALVRRTTRRIAAARSVAVAEDLGIQMNRHSTLDSYLEKLLWMLTGNFAKAGGQYAPTMLVNLASAAPDGSAAGKPRRTSPVVGARIISGLVPCNVIPDEILTDHPKRYRAMLVESGNPAHALADSQRMREALGALELLVVIDIAMTETARLAHYVLPAPSQFEKYEATFFNFEVPKNHFHLRRPLFEAPPNTLPEAEIHARFVEALGAVTEADLAPLRTAAAAGRAAYAEALFTAIANAPHLEPLLPVVLYRTLGPTLPHGAAAAAPLWGLAQRFAMRHPDSLRRAGFTGDGGSPGDQLFDAMLASESGVVFAVDEYDESWRRVRTPDGKLQLVIPELLDELARLASEQPFTGDAVYPFVLSAGERRSSTANTIFRDPRWRKKDADGALRVSPTDAQRLGLRDGGRARVTTKRGSVEVAVEVSAMMQPGHVSLPNGLGCTYPDEAGRPRRPGVPPNELTASEDRDAIAGTPWHKSVPARVEST
ncbi:MAG: molybdopterin-dependent oxidoreductase [Candidatus Binatia bacterium]